MVEWRSVCFTLVLILLCFLGIPIKIDNFQSVEKRLAFKSYLNFYNKSYNVKSEEFEKGFKHFKEAEKYFYELNQDRNKSTELAYYGYSQFADISAEEYKRTYLNNYNRQLHHHHRNRQNFTKQYLNSNNLNHLLKSGNKVENVLPKIIDWRKKGIVTPIKNQGLCGACWAFSTISVAESMAALKTGKLQLLSVQEAIDCAKNGNFGCNGGDTCNLLEWLVDNNIKIETEKEYPLKLKNDLCKLNTKITDGIQILSNYSCNNFVGNENLILNILANHGPVAVAVNAINWQYYLGGIIKFHCDGSLLNLNHAVAIVGYDLTGSVPYYIVRNSWGDKFGEHGYLKIAIGENVCGIANEVAIFDVV